MLIAYLSYFLIFVIVASLLLGFLAMKKPSARRIIIAVVFAAVFLPVLAGYLYMTYFTSIPETVVPELAGLPVEIAIEQLELLGLKGRFAGSVFNPEYPEGSVVSQRPEMGRIVKVGRVVHLLTSSGNRSVKAPNLLGRAADQAATVLAAKGLVLGEVNEDFVSELAPGIILMQSPMPGEDVDGGSKVNITVTASREGIEEQEQEQEEGQEEEKEDGQEKEPEKEERGGFKLW